jgi:hypothetical protein
MNGRDPNLQWRKSAPFSKNMASTFTPISLLFEKLTLKTETSSIHLSISFDSPKVFYTSLTKIGPRYLIKWMILNICFFSYFSFWNIIEILLCVWFTKNKELDKIISIVLRLIPNLCLELDKLKDGKKTEIVHCLTTR